MSKQLNFAQQMDEVLKTLGPQRPKLLLHACCGPCSSAVLEKLCRYFEITVLYYNPNTWPAEEYYRRGEELKKFVAQAHPLGVTVIEDHYDPQEFYTAVQGLENEPERGGRCTVCYRLRMRRAAQYAKEHGFDWFTTTLSISPHKDAARINQIGQELEAEFGIRHLPRISKSRTATCAPSSYRRSMGFTVRITVGVSSAQRRGDEPLSRLPPLAGEVALRSNDGEVYSSRILDTRIAKTISPRRARCWLPYQQQDRRSQPPCR